MADRRFGLGIVSVAFGHETSQAEAARRAADLGFDHIDVSLDRPLPRGPLALPVVDRLTSTARTGCTCRAPRDCTWDEAVAMLRRAPGIRVEPTPASILSNAAAVRAMCEEVPGLAITLDTGWAVYHGEDPLDLIDLAGHVQLRQARRGVAQVHPDDGGDVDFGAVLDGLVRTGYRGALSVEYFDLPDLGLAFGDPLGCCVALAAQVRPLLGARGPARRP
ncbi:MAG TPA: sugar phosphate isomerase/epimerase [Acidimicrobiales bacterium]|nr:sugar phosphate isomerase/epimerase [Acidimicrobiales bacterium]